MGPNRPVQSAAVLPSPVVAAIAAAVATVITTIFPTSAPADAPVTRGTSLAFRHRDRHLYLARQSGEVVSIRPDGRVSAPILDLRRDLGSHREQGLLGLVFSPDGHRMYVYYTSAAGEDTLEEYAVAPRTRGGPVAIDPATKRTLFVLPHPKPTHFGYPLLEGTHELTAAVKAPLVSSFAQGPDGELYVVSQARGVLRIDPR